MVNFKEIEKQLKAINVRPQFWNKPEIRELQHILVPSEQIKHFISGRYAEGFAVLCITDMRVLLIDKKPFFLTLEDIRYDMVTEVDYGHRLLDATISICTPNKTLRFTGYRRTIMRAGVSYIQNRVMEFRQYHMMQSDFAEETTVSAGVQTQVSKNTPFTLDTYAINPEAAQTFIQTRLPSVSLPEAVNPYVKSPLIMRRRVSRF